MMDETQMAARLVAVMGEDGHPSREKTQRVLTNEFVEAMLARGATSADAMMVHFAHQYAGVLKWLGGRRQDEMIREMQIRTGVNLTHWLDAQEGK